MVPLDAEMSTNSLMLTLTVLSILRASNKGATVDTTSGFVFAFILLVSCCFANMLAGFMDDTPPIPLA